MQGYNKWTMNQNLKRIGIWTGVILALAAMVWGLALLGSGPSTDNSAKLSEQLGSDDHVRGNALAKVILVEYSDFQCPACAQFYPIVKQLEQKYGKDILLAYRHFPLPGHDKSQLAARAAEAAAIQGKFWEMHDKLFENQNYWSTKSNAEEIFIDFAVSVGCNRDKFVSDLNSPAVAERVQKNIASGNASGVDSTPTFYLNGAKLNLQTYGDLEAAVAGAISQSK